MTDKLMQTSLSRKGNVLMYVSASPGCPSGMARSRTPRALLLFVVSPSGGSSRPAFSPTSNLRFPLPNYSNKSFESGPQWLWITWRWSYKHA